MGEYSRPDSFLFNAKALKVIFSILSIIEALTEEEKEKLAKIKKKMKRKVSFFIRYFRFEL